MISLKLLLYLAIGTSAMLIPVMIQGAWYSIKWYKRILITVLLTVAGTIGTYILFFIENGWIGGTSFFGAVLFVPILFFPIAKFLRMDYGLLMGICAPAECIMLAIMKVQCILNSCCRGRLITIFTNDFVFPSPVVEMINALLILLVLMLLARKRYDSSKIYPLYMIIYGASRFILNIFREDWIKTEMILPFGNIWSLVSIFVGVAWLIVIKKMTIKEKCEKCGECGNNP